MQEENYKRFLVFLCVLTAFQTSWALFNPFFSFSTYVQDLPLLRNLQNNDFFAMTLYYENYKFNQLTIFRLRKAALRIFQLVLLC